jgi:hypothetical protein
VDGDVVLFKCNAWFTGYLKANIIPRTSMLRIPLSTRYQSKWIKNNLFKPCRNHFNSTLLHFINQSKMRIYLKKLCQEI